MTDDEIETLAKKHICPHHDRLDAILPNRVPYQQTEKFRRVKALIGDVLSKLRAPVADERAALPEEAYAALQYVEGSLAAIANRQVVMGDVIERVDTIAAAAKRAKAALSRLQNVAHHFDAALASAPVAPQACPTDVCQAGKADGVLCANDECDRANGVRPASAPVAGEAQPDRQAVIEAIHRYGNARAMAEHNIAYRDEVRNTYDALIALFDAAPQASTVAGEALTRFCPECGLVGDVASGYRSCCPDGGSARMIPVSMAKKCRDNFLLAINRDAAPQASEAQCSCPSGDGSLRHPCAVHPQASEAVRWLVTDDMRAAVRFAPSSAHWSERLKEFFGPDAREGINALEKQLREARAMLDRQQRAGDSVDLEAAAKTLAECMDYPWTEMPEQGRAHMRTFAQSVVNAALSAQPGAQKSEPTSD